MADRLDVFKLPRPEFEAACRAAASGEGSEWAAVWGGLARLRMPEGDQSLAPHLLRDGFWEPWVTLAVARLVKPGMRCWNIGANVGYYAALLSILVGPTGQVVAIEPCFTSLNCLEASVWGEHRHNGWGNVQTWMVAASDQNGEESLFVDSADLGAATLLTKAGQRLQRVQTMRLDTMRASTNKPIDLIFCDAEGVEDRIFLGSRTIIEDRPIVCLEFSPTKYASPRALLAFFRDVGYESYLIDGTGALVPFDLNVIIREMAWAQVVFLPESPPWSELAKDVPMRHYGS